MAKSVLDASSYKDLGNNIQYYQNKLETANGSYEDYEKKDSAEPQQWGRTLFCATKDSITVAAEEFGSVEPKAGDECVLMGNTENADRQNLVLISATEDGQPRVDVMDGVKDKTFDGALRARLGNLKGISDDRFPANRQPKGNGLYADNAYLKGTFLLETGEDVKTRFEVTEGKIESAVEGLRQDFASDRGYLNNPSFADGMDKWVTENETVFFLVGNRWVWTNGKALAKKGDSASVTKDMGRTVVRIRNKYIRQSHANLQSVPQMAVNAEGKKTAQPVYLAFFYRCAKAGRLTIEFENVDKTGFEDFNSMSVEEDLTETEGYTQYTCSGLWNGTGDFKLSFTGDIYLYMLILSTDKVESLTYKYKTLFEQSEKLVRIAAENFDKDGRVLEGSEIITTSKYNTLMSERFNEDGTLKNRAGLVTTTDWEAWQEQYGEDMEKKMNIEAFAGMFASAVEENTDIVKKADVSAFVKKDENGKLESGVHIGADQITLEGVVTANGNFKILEDGSMEANNAKIKGYIYSVFKMLTKSDAEKLSEKSSEYGTNTEYKLKTNLYVNATFNGVVLPVSKEYEGARVLIMDSYFAKVRTVTPPTTIRTEDGSPIISGLFAQKSTDLNYKADMLCIDAGTVELVLQNLVTGYNSDDKAVDPALQWVLISNTCRNLFWTFGEESYEYRYNINKTNP